MHQTLAALVLLSSSVVLQEVSKAFICYISGYCKAREVVAMVSQIGAMGWVTGCPDGCFFLFSKCVSLVIGKAWALLSGC